MTELAPIAGACAWLGQDIAGSTRWVRDLKPADIAEIESALEGVERRGLAWHEIRRADFPLPGLAGPPSDLAEELEHGRGMTKLRRPPVAPHARGQRRPLFFRLGSTIR